MSSTFPTQHWDQVALGDQVRPEPSNRIHSAVISFFVIGIISFGFLLSSPAFEHWFMIPVALCGILMGSDAVDWARGKVELYDVGGIVGVFGFHFFFLAPLMHVGWDYWMREFPAPPDWRDWLGYMAILNVAGLTLYQVTRRSFFRQAHTLSTFWHVRKAKLQTYLPICIAVSFVLQTYVYISTGGIVGYMRTIQEDRLAFKGMGWLFMISESAPMLVTFYLVLYFLEHKHTRLQLLAALVGLFIVQMYFGGLRGSRGETVRLLFWAVGCYHFIVHRVPRSVILTGCAVMIVFLYVYGFYKAMGADATQAFSSGQHEYLSQKTGRSFEGLALGDFGRSDVQAMILYRLTTDPHDFTYAKGRTYLGSLMLPIPSFLLPVKPATKLKEGTEIRSGSGSYVPDVFTSTRVYGLAGEGMLNFGPMVVPVLYGLFGILVAWIGRNISSLHPGDARFFLVPLVVYLAFNVVLVDSDNLVFDFVKTGLLPTLLLWWCTSRFRVAPAPAARSANPMHLR
jgi:hypothetical protein